MVFTPRLTIPDKGNKFYNTKSSGGYSNAIKGKPTQDGLDVLSNCVGYAYGRFHEIANDTKMSMLKPVNAELFIDYKAKSLKVGTEPKLGACIVWQKGATKNGSDGAGHVAIVEKINADGSIVTSESGWGSSKVFWTQTRKNDGNWSQASSYKFLGFIYQPKEYEPEYTEPTVTFGIKNVFKGCKGDYVKPVQIILKGLGYYTDKIDGNAGKVTNSAIIEYQRQRGLAIDGVFGLKCWESFLGR